MLPISSASSPTASAHVRLVMGWWWSHTRKRSETQGTDTIKRSL
jgi:hypothetical protein